MPMSPLTVRMRSSPTGSAPSGGASDASSCDETVPLTEAASIQSRSPGRTNRRPYTPPVDDPQGFSMVMKGSHWK